MALCVCVCLRPWLVGGWVPRAASIAPSTTFADFSSIGTGSIELLLQLPISASRSPTIPLSSSIRLSKRSTPFWACPHEGSNTGLATGKGVSAGFASLFGLLVRPRSPPASSRQRSRPPALRCARSPPQDRGRTISSYHPASARRSHGRRPKEQRVVSPSANHCPGPRRAARSRRPARGGLGRAASCSSARAGTPPALAASAGGRLIDEEVSGRGGGGGGQV